MSPAFGSKPRKKVDFQTPGVVFQPEASESMQAGINKLVKLIRPTLGPLPHVVGIEPVSSRNNYA